MTSPRSVRFDPDVLDRLHGYVRAHPGLSASAVTNRFVDEALRMEAHPGGFFREGPAGRRAVLVGGPDVWEVIRAVRSARAADPDSTADEVIDLVAETSGVSRRQVLVSVDYWTAYPDEIDEWIRVADDADRDAFEQWQRRQKLLAS